MKLLLLTAEHPGNQYGGLGTFIRDLSRELKPLCVLKVIYFNLEAKAYEDFQTRFPVDEVITPRLIFPTHTFEGKALEAAASLQSQLDPIINSFQPDVIHCNDRQTYLPVRFRKNVVYSFHLPIGDLVGTKGLEESYLQELKIERLAAEKSAAVLVYSSFIRDRVIKNISSKASPTVVPLGIPMENFSSHKDERTIRISYFGRFEDIQKGFFSFVRAVMEIPEGWQTQYNVEFNLFGRGDLPPWLPRERFSRIDFLGEDNLRATLAETSIVVMPSRYEPFGLVGLEALASGCLLLCPAGLGMDEYLTSGNNINFIPIEVDEEDIRSKIVQVAENFKDFEDMRARAKDTVLHWTIQRCAKAHLEVYKIIKDKKDSALRLIHSSTAWNQLNRMKRIGEKHLLEVLEELYMTLRSEVNVDLLMGPASHQMVNQSGVKINVLDPLDGGITGGRLELLDFPTASLSTGFVVGALETSLELGLAFSELNRVFTSTLIFVCVFGKFWPGQTLTCEHKEDWISVFNHFLPNWVLSDIESTEQKLFIKITLLKKDR